MCNDIPRNRLHEKMFGELIAEELHRTLSHINCTPASVVCFGELAGCKSETTCCATWVPKIHMTNLGIFLGLCGFLERKNAGKYEYIGMCMRENGTICAFGVFSQVLWYFSRQNWTLSL